MTNSNDASSSVSTASPCVKICVLDPRSGFCLGCGRTANEIQDWVHYPSEKKHELIKQLPERIAGLTKRPRRGREKRLREPQARPR